MAGTVINERGIIYSSIKNTLNQLGFWATNEDKKNCYGREKKNYEGKRFTKKINLNSVKLKVPKKKNKSLGRQGKGGRKGGLGWAGLSCWVCRCGQGWMHAWHARAHARRRQSPPARSPLAARTPAGASAGWA